MNVAILIGGFLLAGLIFIVAILERKDDIDRSDWQMDVKFGDMFYSDYFGSYCVVVKIIGKEWFFCVEKGRYAGVIQRARANPALIEFVSNLIKKEE